MSGKLLIQIHIPVPNRESRNVLNRELERESAYDTTTMQQQVQTNVPLMNDRKRMRMTN